MGEQLTWDTVDTPDAVDLATVDTGLDTFNRGAADFASIRRLACFARGASGEVIGGAVGRYWGAACELQQLWVRGDRRRDGIGTRLVRAFEAGAMARGCSLVYLDTFSFQAPSFYQGLGYAVACELPGFPGGGSKFIMQRTLGSRTAP